MAKRPSEAELFGLSLVAWVAGMRDLIIREAYRKGATKTDIHEATGLARTTIDRIVRDLEES